MQLEDYFEFVSPNEIKLKNHRIYMEDVLYEYVHRAQSLESLTTRFDTLTKAEIKNTDDSIRSLLKRYAG
jgi:hypothetical protein